MVLGLFFILNEFLTDFFMRKIFIKNGIIGKTQMVFLEYPYNFELKELVKAFPGIDWKFLIKIWNPSIKSILF